MTTHLPRVAAATMRWLAQGTTGTTTDDDHYDDDLHGGGHGGGHGDFGGESRLSLVEIWENES